ncbi:DoxX family protein [Paenibacillus filicis]|uniref:DoxX family protein n=1 Tax=Paenibacillus filicis TaxID=669464 RepID=A0ABU9DFC7_9BACL
MAPLIALIASFLVFRLLGLAGWTYMNDWHTSLQGAVAVMFLLTASAHWGRRRPDLVRMVPPSLPQPELLVTLTGLLELAGAVGILLPATSSLASVLLVILLILMFPANVRAARERLTIAGALTPRLIPRTLMQLLFLAAVWLAG